MSDKQKEAAASKTLATRYSAISAIFDKLPARFKMDDAIRLAKLKKGNATNVSVVAVLSRDFKCISVGRGFDRVWKKP